jgi:antitoxin CcdA
MLRFAAAAERATTSTLSSKVLVVACDPGMDQSQIIDAPPAEKVRRRYWERWNADNRGAIDAYNERIERDGLPLAKHRSFAKGR